MGNKKGLGKNGVIQYIHDNYDEIKEGIGANPFSRKTVRAYLSKLNLASRATVYNAINEYFDVVSEANIAMNNTKVVEEVLKPSDFTMEGEGVRKIDAEANEHLMEKNLSLKREIEDHIEKRDGVVSDLVGYINELEIQKHDLSRKLELAVVYSIAMTLGYMAIGIMIYLWMN